MKWVSAKNRIPTFPDLSKPTEDGLVEPCFVERFAMEKITAERAALHRHPHYEIFWVQSGGGVHISDFRAHSFGAGSLIFVGLGRVHNWRLRAGTRGFLTAFSIEALGGSETAGSMEMPFFCHLTGQPVVKVNRTQRAELTRILEGMLMEYNARLPQRAKAMQAWLKLFLVQCARSYPQNVALGGGTAALLTQHFFTAMETEFMGMKEVAGYAARLGVTSHRLIEAVRERTGRTPGKLLEERLYLEAKRLLFHTTRTVAEIAYELKFNDPSHFGRFFKRHAGCSPGEARERFFESGQIFAA